MIDKGQQPLGSPVALIDVSEKSKHPLRSRFVVLDKPLAVLQRLFEKPSLLRNWHSTNPKNRVFHALRQYLSVQYWPFQTATQGDSTQIVVSYLRTSQIA